MSTTELADSIDALWAIDNQIDGLNVQLKALQANRRAAELKVMSLLSDAGLRGAMGALATATIGNKVVFNPDTQNNGWPKIYARIQRTGEFDLLHKRLTNTAVAERFNAGDAIDGIIRSEIPELKVKLK